MCNYCGCRAVPPVARLTADHEAIADAAGLLREAIVGGRAIAPQRLDALLGSGPWQARPADKVGAVIGLVGAAAGARNAI